MNKEIIKYLKNGTKVKVNEYYGDKAEVEKFILVECQDYNGEFFEDEILQGNSFLISKTELYEKPPIDSLNKNLVEINNKLSKAYVELSNVQEELRNKQKECAKINKQNDDLYKDLSKEHKMLSYIKDFVNKDLKYCVQDKYGKYLISKIDKVLCMDRDYSEYNHGKEIGYKLISLFGNTKGDYEWKVNEYKDGSGYYKSIIPCKSLKEAFLLIDEKVLEKINIINNNKSSINDWYHKWAIKRKLKLPIGYLEYYKEKKKNDINKNLKIETTKLNRLENIIKTLKESLNKIENGI